MLLTLLDLLSKRNDELPLYTTEIKYENRVISPLEFNHENNSYTTYYPSLGELIIDSMGNCVNKPSIKTTIINNSADVVIEY